MASQERSLKDFTKEKSEQLKPADYVKDVVVVNEPPPESAAEAPA